MVQSVKLLDQLERGVFRGVALGQTRSEVRNALGRPPQAATAKFDDRKVEAIWKFGELEVFFDASDLVVGLQLTFATSVQHASLRDLLDDLSSRGIAHDLDENNEVAAVRFCIGRTGFAQCSYRKKEGAQPTLEVVSGFA